MTVLDRRLAGDEVHVWRASLDQEPCVVEALASLLADDERERAKAFRFDRDRDRYIVGRGVLRTLLGSYLGVAPDTPRLSYGTYGKPALDGDGPWFNVSHSGPMALFAISYAVEVGVDLELSRSQPDVCRIAEHFFSEAEVARLREVPAHARDGAFLACWTRKEAFLKARGDGLSLALDAFDVDFGPGSPCALLRTAWSVDEPDRWRLADLSDLGAGYFAALAAREGDWQINTMHLDTIPIHEQYTTPSRR